MKVIILAGGFGTRISEETDNKPKPMVLIAGKPIIWHIMHSYALQGFNDFVIAAGYKSEVIQSWVSSLKETWNIAAVDTGLYTQTAGRLKRCIETFPESKYCVTYGDGLASVDVRKLVEFHANSGQIATVTAVRPPARFGVLEIRNGVVTQFREKSQADEGWINGGFFVVKREIHDWIASDEENFESTTLPNLVQANQLSAFEHTGFWQPMDTLREKKLLEELAQKGNPPWLRLSV